MSEPRDREVEWEISFTLAAGHGEDDAIALYEYIEQHPSVDGAVLSGRFLDGPSSDEADMSNISDPRIGTEKGKRDARH